MKSSYPSLTTSKTSSQQQFTGSFDKLKLESQLVAGSLSQTNSNNDTKIKQNRFANENEYQMDHSKRGIALIINNKIFDPRLDMVNIIIYLDL